MESADQQLKHSCTTNPVSLSVLQYVQDRLDFFLGKQSKTRMIPTFLSTALSIPLKAFIMDSGISVGEK